MRKFEGLSLYTLAFALASGAFVASPAAAQATAQGDAPAQSDTTEDDIVVTGYRASIQGALDLKRKAVGSEENILAQDIASFPDLNLAESIQRVSGVTITRDSGEGRQITLRGLGPDFTRTELNGMEVLGNTASGMDNRGATSRTRSFDFSLFASELFNRVTVKKSYSADQDEGGIGGTVALYTAKPFDYQGPKAVLVAKGIYNDYTDRVTPRIVALLSHTWGDFGILATAAYGQVKTVEYGYRNWNWGQVTYGAANVGSGIDAATRARLTSTGADRLFSPAAQSPSSWYTDRKRLGLTTALQYHPGDNFKLDVDLLYGRLQDFRNDWALAAAGTNPLTGNVTGTQVIQSAVIKGNALVGGSWTGIDLRNEHHFVRNSTEFYQAVGNMEWKLSDQLTLSALLGYEQSNFAQPVFDKVYLQSSGYSYSMDQRPDMPANTYSAGLTDPDRWGLMRMDTQENEINSKFLNAKVNLAYEVSPSSAIRIGSSFKRFDNDGYQYVNRVFYNTGTTNRAIPNDLKLLTDVGTLLPYIGGRIDETYDFIGQRRNLNSADLQTGTNFVLREETWNGFAQYELNTEVGDMRLRANAGLHYFSTQLTSSGSLVSSTGFAPVTVLNKTDGWLPAVNVALDVTDRFILRASANKNVNRPALNDLSAAAQISISAGTSGLGGGIGVGNPNLKPFKALNIEGSAEYYFTKGYASLGFFYKKMDSFITSETTTIPFSQTGYPTSILPPTVTPDREFTYTRPINGAGASIQGIEAAFQHDFTFLPAPFDGLGVVLNGTYFHGNQKNKYTFNNVTQLITVPLYNLSKWAANATIYYENKQWGMRVSDAYRSNYLIGPGFNGMIGEGFKGSHNIDAQAHFSIMPKVRLTLEGINLTNQHIYQFTDLTGKLPIANTSNGRTFTLGVTAEF